MSGPVFVVDAGGTPLMPMSAAYARKLLRESKARRLAHSAFTVIQLSRRIEQPILRPIVATLKIHLRTAELFLIAEGQQGAQPLAHIIIDLRTDLPRRLRRRAGHRRRRRSRQRYHALARHGRPFKLRRPSLARSEWGSTYLRARYRRLRASRQIRHEPPIFRWRAQAIRRTLDALQKFMPLGHILLLDSTSNSRHVGRPLTPAARRLRLIAAYGFRDAQGRLIPVCAFCGTTEGVIEVEHLLPVSRGGTDAWENLALACQACNRRKGGQVPEEAHMPLLLHHGLSSHSVGRLRPYVDGTLRALLGELRLSRLRMVSLSSLERSALPKTVIDAALAMRAQRPSSPKYVIAYPVTRPRKQRFSARNYPLNTPSRADHVRVGQTIKRLVRVNQGLRLYRAKGRITTQVVPVGPATSPLHDEGGLLIRPGMLCAATRAQQPVVGIISAIHSSGRLTLRVLGAAHAEGVTWRSVVVSPRQGLRVISSDRVVFCRLPVEDENDE